MQNLQNQGKNQLKHGHGVLLRVENMGQYACYTSHYIFTQATRCKIDALCVFKGGNVTPGGKVGPGCNHLARPLSPGEGKPWMGFPSIHDHTLTSILPQLQQIGPTLAARCLILWAGNNSLCMSVYACMSFRCVRACFACVRALRVCGACV